MPTIMKKHRATSLDHRSFIGQSNKLPTSQCFINNNLPNINNTFRATSSNLVFDETIQHLQTNYQTLTIFKIVYASRIPPRPSEARERLLTEGLFC